MPQAFTCPSCGGSIETDGSQPTVKCPYCGSVVQVPDAIRQVAVERQTAQAVNRTTRFFWIFIILVFGVPTCLGIAGAVIGLVVSVAAPLLAIVLSVLLGT
jgi:hypothetical protein